MNTLSLSKVLAIVALIAAIASFFVSGPLIAIAVILLAIALIV
jgi:hypothetical protein